MSLLKKFASELSGKNQETFAFNSAASTSNRGANQPKQIWWQCKYCGKRTATWSNSNSVPNAGICQARSKTNDKFPKPHEWHKIR